MSESGSSSTSDETIMKKSQRGRLDDDSNTFKDLLDLMDTIDEDDFCMPMMFARFNVCSFRKKIKEKVQNDEDIAFLVQMFIEYGNNVKKIINTPDLSEATSERFMLLTKKFDIKEKVGRNSNDVITLSRIATAFPDVVAPIYEANPNIPGPITLKEIRLVSDHPEFPSLARESSLACFLPKTHAESHNILNVFFLAKMMFSEKINQNSPSWYNMTKLQRALNTKYYQMKAFNSPISSEEARKSWCIRLKIMEGNDYSAVWKEAAVKSRAQLEKDYGTGVTF